MDTSEKRKNKPLITLIAVFILLNLCCIAPLWVSDLIELATDPYDMPSIVCRPASGLTLALMLGLWFVTYLKRSETL